MIEPQQPQPVPGKIVIVMDTHILSMKTNVERSALMGFVNNNTTILWTSRISYNVMSHESVGISEEYKKVGLKFVGEISGLLGSHKNMKQFRQYFRGNSWLSLPIVYIDSDSNGLMNGGWDYSVSVQDYMTCPDRSSNFEILDLQRMFVDICCFVEKWYSSDENNKRTSCPQNH